MMTAEVCPECSAGKHDNCDGTSWDFTMDEYAVCPCYRVGHDTTRFRPQGRPDG